jgi:hypothetical protein
MNRRLWLYEQEDMVVRRGGYGCMKSRIWLYEQEDIDV